MTKPIFSRQEILSLCKRFVKPEQYTPSRDAMVMYQLIKQFPDCAFWRNYELGFCLNSMFWFKSRDGQDRLKTDWSLFHLDMKGEQRYDKLDENKNGEDVVVEKSIKTVADLLR